MATQGTMITREIMGTCQTMGPQRIKGTWGTWGTIITWTTGNQETLLIKSLHILRLLHRRNLPLDRLIHLLKLLCRRGPPITKPLYLFHQTTSSSETPHTATHKESPLVKLNLLRLLPISKTTTSCQCHTQYHSKRNCSCKKQQHLRIKQMSSCTFMLEHAHMLCLATKNWNNYGVRRFWDHVKVHKTNTLYSIPVTFFAAIWARWYPCQVLII